MLVCFRIKLCWGYISVVSTPNHWRNKEVNPSLTPFEPRSWSFFLYEKTRNLNLGMCSSQLIWLCIQLQEKSWKTPFNKGCNQAFLCTQQEVSKMLPNQKWQRWFPVIIEQGSHYLSKKKNEMKRKIKRKIPLSQNLWRKLGKKLGHPTDCNSKWNSLGKGWE